MKLYNLQVKDSKNKHLYGIAGYGLSGGVIPKRAKAVPIFTPPNQCLLHVLLAHISHSSLFHHCGHVDRQRSPGISRPFLIPTLLVFPILPLLLSRFWIARPLTVDPPKPDFLNRVPTKTALH